MTYQGGDLALWVSRYNTAAADLATRTAERDTARNALYVSGTYLSGQTWQAKDAADLALYNAEVTSYNAMTADRDAWHANANNVWGPSGNYGVGPSYQSLATQAFASGGAVWGTNVALAGNHGAGFVNHNVSGQTTVPLNGRFFVCYAATGDGGNANSEASRSYRVLVNGSIILAVGPASTGFVVADLTGGQFIGFQSDFTGGFDDTKGTIFWVFIPTAEHPS